MTEPKFTPGPWFPHVSYMEGFCVDVDKPATVEDMRLIRAAPELYEALEKIRHWGESQHKAQSKGGHATFDMMMLREQIDTAKAALEKARGESHD